MDRERVLAKVDALDTYLAELQAILPPTFEEYLRPEKRRACERLLQIAIETVIDLCALLVIGLRLGLPAEEEDLFERLEKAAIIDASLKDVLRAMKGFRNVLVHEYGRLDDRVVFELARTKREHFERFKQAVLHALPA